MKSLAALGVDFKTLSTLVSEISIMLFMMNRISFLSGFVFALAQTGFAQTICPLGDGELTNSVFPWSLLPNPERGRPVRP
jgi:hypothetical protein